MTTRPAASERENALIAVASADILGIDDVKTALDQPLDDRPGNALVREKIWHA